MESRIAITGQWCRSARRGRWLRPALYAGSVLLVASAGGTVESAPPIPSATVVAPADDPPGESPPAVGILEQVVYRQGDEERTTIASVQVDGTDLILTIFSSILAVEYEMRITSDALVSSRRLGAEELEAELVHRAACREEQARKRELARQKREERKRREAEEAARSAPGRDTRSEERGASRRSRARVEREESTVTSGQLDRAARQLDARKEEVLRRTRGLLAAVAVRREEVPSLARELREIQVWLEEVELDLERLERRLGARHRASTRLKEDERSGSLRGAELADQRDLIFGQYELLASQYDEIDETLVAQAEAFSLVPEEEPPPVVEPDSAVERNEAERTPSLRPPSAGVASRPPAARASGGATPHGTALLRSEWTAEERALHGEEETTGADPVPAVARLAPEPVGSEPSPSRSEEPPSPAGTEPRSQLPIWPLYVMAMFAVFLSWRRRAAPVIVKEVVAESPRPEAPRRAPPSSPSRSADRRDRDGGGDEGPGRPGVLPPG